MDSPLSILSWSIFIALRNQSKQPKTTKDTRDFCKYMLMVLLSFLFTLLQKCIVCIWIHRWLQGWCKGHLLQSHSEASLNTRFLYEVTSLKLPDMGTSKLWLLHPLLFYFKWLHWLEAYHRQFLCFLECMERWQNAEWGIDYKVQWMRCLLKRPRPTWHHRKLLPN